MEYGNIYCVKIQMKSKVFVLLLMISSYSSHGQMLSQEMQSRRILLDSIGLIKNGEDVSKIQGYLVSIKQLALLVEYSKDRYNNCQVFILGKIIANDQYGAVLIKVLRNGTHEVTFEALSFHFQFGVVMISKYLVSYDSESEKASIIVKEKFVEILISYFKCENGECSDRPYKFFKARFKQNQLGSFDAE